MDTETPSQTGAASSSASATAHFFRVEHDLLRSESFKTLTGSAIKVYLVIGLYADFGTGWAFPSIRTIARQAGVSRQTVLDAITELARTGMLITSKTKGKSTAYQILRPAPGPERPAKTPRNAAKTAAAAATTKTTTATTTSTPTPAPTPAPTPTRKAPGSSFSKGNGGVQTGPISLPPASQTGPKFLEGALETGLNSLGAGNPGGQESLTALAQFFGHGGPAGGPERKTGTRSDTPTAPIPGTAFRITLRGELVAAESDLLRMLSEEGIPQRLAEQFVARQSGDIIAKVLLNALYLKSQGKLQNGPGYIRAAVESGYELIPQVASRLEMRRRELEMEMERATERDRKRREALALADEEAAINQMINNLRPEHLEKLLRQALEELPEPFVSRNPTLSNPFIRGKIYELAGGKPLM